MEPNKKKGNKVIIAAFITAAGAIFAAIVPNLFPTKNEQVQNLPSNKIGISDQERIPTPIETRRTSRDTFKYSDALPCKVRTKPLVSLHEEPERFSQEIIRVPIGTYRVIFSIDVKNAIGSERWLYIKVGSREGWIEDNTFNISSKSNNCK